MILDGLPGLIVGDLVLCEVLQGLASEKEASLAEAALRRFDVRAMAGPHSASASATNIVGLGNGLQSMPCNQR